MAIILLHVCLLLAFEFYTQASECDADDPCLGRRPRGINGCCPLMKGGRCKEDGNRKCDKQLGYLCVNGFCRGRFNLTAANIGSSGLELSWTDFIPENYLYEYIVMYTNKFEQDLEKWEHHGYGIAPHITLWPLESDEWYFIRVGVWDDPDTFTFLNITETLMVKTNAIDHCFNDGRQIEIGGTVIIECQESCTCLPTGEFRCVSVCPSGNVDTPVCTDREENCCNFVEQCITASNCSYQGNHIKHGQSWLIGCLENCTCENGIVTCFPVCEDETDTSFCKDEEFRKSNEECCNVYLECTKTETIDSLLVAGQNELDKTTLEHKSDGTQTKVTKKTNNNETNNNVELSSGVNGEVKGIDLGVTFRADKISATFAVLQWYIPDNVESRNCTLVVKYKPLSDFEWAFTGALQANTTGQCVVKCLKYSSWYIAQLVAVNCSKTLGETFFNTTKLTDSTELALQPRISATDIETTEIRITWKSSTFWNNSDVLYTEIFWTKANNDYNDLSHTCIDKNTKNEISVKDLTPETLYLLWIGVIFTDSRVVYSNQLHFVTAKYIDSSTSFHEHSKIIAIAISCTSVVILFITFISVVYVVKYRRRRTNWRQENAFENKIFQIH